MLIFVKIRKYFCKGREKKQYETEYIINKRNMKNTFVKEKCYCAYGFVNVLEETVYLVHFAERIGGKLATFNVVKK